MRVKITIEIERNGYTATETVEYIDRTPADIAAGMVERFWRLQEACNLREERQRFEDEALDRWRAEYTRQANLAAPLTGEDHARLERLWSVFAMQR